MKTDVVVIGAGILGASTAWALSRHSDLKVLVVERSSPGSGATGRSSAMIRMHYTNPHEATLALESFEVFTSWDEQVGGECGFTRTGFLRIVEPSNEPRLVRNVERLQQLGINTRTVSAEEVQALFPECSTVDFSLAAYEPESGYADPALATGSLIDAARHRGARLQTATEATEIRLAGSRVVGIETTNGRIDAPIIILAAGPWGNNVLRSVGLELPMRPYLESVAVVERPAGFSEDYPGLIDGVNDIYFRPERPNLTLVGNGHFQEADPDNFNQSVTPEFTEDVLRRLISRVPAMSEAGVRGGWSAVDAMSPDGHPIIGPIDGVEGLYVALGASGTGFKIAPAVGQLLARAVTTPHPIPELHPFRPERFDDGEWLRDENDYGDRADTGTREEKSEVK